MSWHGLPSFGSNFSVFHEKIRIKKISKKHFCFFRKTFLFFEFFTLLTAVKSLPKT